MGNRSKGWIGRGCMWRRLRVRKPCNSCDKLNQVPNCAPQNHANLIEFAL